MLHETIDISKYYGPHYNKYLYQYWNIKVYPSSNYGVQSNIQLYFDHKVARDSSSFPYIYIFGYIPNNGNFGSLLKELPSRYKIEELNQLYISYTDVKSNIINN